ncbi:MAG: molybdopterin-guanine dinucleotide biosynthesis protein B [Oscillospiraceae bacterium]|nr:molybdopterin-guanine dinucleotide biosynthesis protein B [Oscillospiraceae bacterium]
MDNIPIYSIVAYSGTGKTTLLVKLIKELKSRGIRLAVIKHDAHEFEIDREGKDSWRFTQAGADVTAVISATKAAVIESRPVDINDLLRRITDVDIILTEGYKTGPWPKIAVQRLGSELPVPAESCLAIVTDTPGSGGIPEFGLEDAAALAEFIIAQTEADK